MEQLLVDQLVRELLISCVILSIYVYRKRERDLSFVSQRKVVVTQRGT